MHNIFFYILFGVLTLFFLYFFATTKLTILANRIFPSRNAATSHIYWIYRNKWLIRLTDRQAVISAILLFQYNKLVNRIVDELRHSMLQGKNVMQASCAFGDVTPKIVSECIRQEVKDIVITDINDNELLHIRSKLGDNQKHCRFLKEDTLYMQHEDNTFDVVIMFFLLHELPNEKKYRALEEAARVLRPGGKLIIGEFHKPKPFVLKVLGWIYFNTFEPYALQVWENENPSRILKENIKADWDIKTETCFFDNYQTIMATKK